jgi:hypothetical protein
MGYRKKKTKKERNKR